MTPAQAQQHRVTYWKPGDCAGHRWDDIEYSPLTDQWVATCQNCHALQTFAHKPLVTREAFGLSVRYPEQIKQATRDTIHPSAVLGGETSRLLFEGLFPNRNDGGGVPNTLWLITSFGLVAAGLAVLLL